MHLLYKGGVFLVIFWKCLNKRELRREKKVGKGAGREKKRVKQGG